MNHCLLYFFVAFSAFVLAFFNFSVFGKGGDIQCFTETTAETTTETSTDSSTTDTNSGTTGTRMLYEQEVPSKEQFIRYLQDTVQVDEGDPYRSMVFLVAFMYLIVAGVAFLLSLLLMCMANMIPEDFADAGCLKRGAGWLCKVLPKVNLVVHYLILVVVLYIWVLVLTDACMLSKPSATATQPTVSFNRFAYYDDVRLAAIVDIAVWGALQYLVAMFRNMMYQEPFMYAPVVGTQSPVISILWSSVGP